MKRETIEHTWWHCKNTHRNIVECAKISKRDGKEKIIEKTYKYIYIYIYIYPILLLLMKIVNLYFVD